MRTSTIFTFLVLFSLIIFSCSKTEEVTIQLTPESSDYAFIKSEVELFTGWVEDVSKADIDALELDFELIVQDSEFCQVDCGEVPEEYMPYAAPENIEKINQLAVMLGFEDGIDLFLHMSEVGRLVNGLYSKFQPANRGTFLLDLVGQAMNDSALSTFDESAAAPYIKRYLVDAYGNFTQHAALGSAVINNNVRAHPVLYGNGSAVAETVEALQALLEVSTEN